MWTGSDDTLCDNREMSIISSQDALALQLHVGGINCLKFWEKGTFYNLNKHLLGQETHPDAVENISHRKDPDIQVRLNNPMELYILLIPEESVWHPHL